MNDAKKTLRNKPPRKAAGAKKTSITVLRDHTFHRSVADNALTFNLGRDMEIAFLQYGPRPTSIEDVDERLDKVALASEAFEVTRVRMSKPAILGLAMNILEVLVESDSVKTDKVLEFVQQLLPGKIKSGSAA